LEISEDVVLEGDERHRADKRLGAFSKERKRKETEKHVNYR